MAESKILNSPAILTRTVSVTLPANSTNVSITAPTVSGYTFLCWLGVASQGSVKLAYLDGLTGTNQRIWVESKRSEATRFDAYALYRKGL